MMLCDGVIMALAGRYRIPCRHQNTPLLWRSSIGGQMRHCCSIAWRTQQSYYYIHKFLFDASLSRVHRRAINRPEWAETSLRSISNISGKHDQKLWHSPSFMKECSPDEIEQWLLLFLKSNAEQNRGDDHTQSNIDSIAYLRVLDAYAKSKIGGAPQKAEYWIGQLEQHYAQAAKSCLRSISTFNESDNNDAHSFGTNINTASLDEKNLNKSPFAALIASRPLRNRDYVQQSTETQNVLVSQSRSMSFARNLQPTVDCYNAVIEAWGNNTDEISVVRSRRWLSKLEEGIDCPFPSNHPLYFELHPDAKSYDLYLHSCSRGIGRQLKLHRQRAEEAEKLLRFRVSHDAPLMIRPSTASYNYVIRAWTRCRKEMCVAEKVMHLVREMEAIQRDNMQSSKTRNKSEHDLWKQHIRPNTKTYTMAIDSWVVVAGLKAQLWYSNQLELQNVYKQISVNQQVDKLKFRKKSLFDRRCNNFGDDGSVEMENAASILKYISTLEGVGRDDVKATVVGYNTLLSGWARLSNEMRPEIALKSEAILREMMELFENGNEHAAPDVVSFNAVIKAWASAKQSNSASRCEWWLRKMIKESNNTDLQYEASVPKPNVQTYNIVMEAFLHLGDPAKVQDIILEMDASKIVSPDSESFSKVIRAWLRDEINHQQKYGLSGVSCENAWKWLKELLEREKSGQSSLGSAPDLFASVLKTAAKTSSRGENLLIVGQETFWAMRESRFGINALAYEWLLEIGLKVLSSPEMDKRRENFVKSLLEQCCKDGFLSRKFVSKVSALEVEQLAQEEGENKIFNKYLGKPPYPATWNRNLPDRLCD